MGIVEVIVITIIIFSVIVRDSKLETSITNWLEKKTKNKG
jgi:hypothetical protein